MAVFLLIGKTSALTMNIAGVVKDWMLIGLSVLLYASPVTPLNLGGYFLAFLAGEVAVNGNPLTWSVAACFQSAPALTKPAVSLQFATII